MKTTLAAALWLCVLGVAPTSLPFVLAVVAMCVEAG